MAATLSAPSPSPMSWPSEVTHRRTATVRHVHAGRVLAALTDMPDVRVACTVPAAAGGDPSVTFTVECGPERLADVAGVFRVLGLVPARV